MKQGELKRILVVFSILCILICIYFYWQQASSISADRIVFTYKHPQRDRPRKSQRPQWTWQCINQRCERRHIKDTSSASSSSSSITTTSNNIPKVSLSTCSMLCGSTQLWPQPTGPVTLGSRAVTFTHRQIQYETNCKNPAKLLIDQAFAAFNETIVNLIENKNYTQQVSEIQKLLVKITITNSEIVKLKLDTNEAYSLVIKPARENEIVVNITAASFFGARHGLETLSQLVWWDEYAGDDGMLKILKAGTIQDAPSFAYRGIMVDTARNYMSLESLKRVLVGMSACKLNVFHWHITDSQSFPLVLKSVPQLAQNGAYSSLQVYTPSEIEALVEFARIRGIRVILEVDTPAHAGNGWDWGPSHGLGDLAVCINAKPWSLYCGEPPCGQLNPDNANVFTILEKIYREIIEITGEREIFHLGGDEVNLECWAQHLQPVNYTDLHDLWGEFLLKAAARLQLANKGEKVEKVIVWSSNLSKRPYISKYFDRSNVVVQSWGGSQWPDTPELVADGYEVIISHVDAWYLDCGFGRWREAGEGACDPYRPWQTVYNHRPWQQLHLNKKQVLGGEACVWSEQVDEGALDGRLWPRAAAFAERVWSDPAVDVNSWAIQEDVYTRLTTHRERLVGRGLGAEAMWPVWCSQNPGMCL